MISLLLLIKKNLILLLRSKASALIIIFAPLLIILLLGLSYNTSNQYGLNIGIVAPSLSEDVNSFITLLQEEEFQIITYENNLDNCVEDIKSGKVHTCIILPENLQVEDNTQKEIVFHVDPSRVNLVSVVQETVKESFNLKAQQLSEELTQDILGKLISAQDNIAQRLMDLNAIKERTTTASDSLNTVKNDLTGLDLGLIEESTSVNSTETTDTLIEIIDDAIDKVDDAKSAVSGSGLEDEVEETIRTPLNDAEDKLDQLKEEISGNESDSFGGVLLSLQADLNSVNEKLTAVASIIENSDAQLTEVTNTLTETSQAIDSVQSSLNEIHGLLSGQKVTEAGTITAPLITRIEKVGQEGTYLNYLFPALLVLVVMFSSLLLGTTLVMMDKNSPAFFRNYFLPVRRITFILSTYFTCLVLILVEIAIILILSLIFLSSSFSSLLLVALILLIAASVFSLLGMAVGYLFNSEETSVLAAVSLGSLFLFISGVILPLEGVSPFLRKISFFNPFVLAEKLVREIFLFNSAFSNILLELGILIGYALILFGFIIFIEWLLHKHFLQKFFHRHPLNKKLMYEMIHHKKDQKKNE